jgi:signal transduction histidine kinase/CheY-like chemotaxis protein
MAEKNKTKFAGRRIKAIQVTSFISFIITLIIGVPVYLFGNVWLSYLFIFSSIAFGVANILSRKQQAQKARIIFLWMFNLFIALLSAVLGKEASVEFFLIFSIGLTFAFFSFTKEKVKIYMFCFLSFFLWLLLYFTNFKLFLNFDINSSLKTSNIVYHFTITIILILVSLQLIYYSYTNARLNISAHYNKKEAVNASDAKSQFLSTMSHEIRTPLNAVIGLSHILGNENPREDQVENIEALNYSGKILLNLLNNVLDFSKIQSSTIDLDNVPLDLSEAIKQIKKVHEASCLQKGIIMNLEIDEEIPNVWIDIVRFNQIINNLVSNAIKFTKEGSVTLRIKKIGQTDSHTELLTEIVDTGIGIPEDKFATIWEAFTQASSQTNRLYGGTGLGLPIVKSIVKSMNSDVFIESKVGKGSRFFFTLNLELATEKDLIKTNQKKTYNFTDKHILLVEDNKINVMVAKQILEKVNLKVTVAFDGLEAVNLVKEKSFDLVLMDIQMPIMDGYTASREIRKFNKKLPILAVSASVFMEVKDEIHESGMNGFIFKPFDPEDLLYQIEEIINT